MKFQDQIFKAWLLMKRFSPLEPFQNASESIHKEQPNNDDLDHFFRIKFNQPATHSTVNKTDEEMQQKILNISNQVQLSLSDNVLHNWEMRRYDEPNLFKISQVVLAVPPTQVSVERAFSALGLILTARRNRLSDKTIDDLLVCKLNSDVFDRI
jgi:hAT family C-terminal dimerisation region